MEDFIIPKHKPIIKNADKQSNKKRSNESNESSLFNENCFFDEEEFVIRENPKKNKIAEDISSINNSFQSNSKNASFQISSKADSKNISRNSSKNSSYCIDPKDLPPGPPIYIRREWDLRYHYKSNVVEYKLEEMKNEMEIFSIFPFFNLLKTEKYFNWFGRLCFCINFIYQSEKEILFESKLKKNIIPKDLKDLFIPWNQIENINWNKKENKLTILWFFGRKSLLEHNNNNNQKNRKSIPNKESIHNQFITSNLNSEFIIEEIDKNQVVDNKLILIKDFVDEQLIKLPIIWSSNENEDGCYDGIGWEQISILCYIWLNEKAKQNEKEINHIGNDFISESFIISCNKIKNEDLLQ